jgi:predicted GIY-YIG superfamily endonuclease
MVKCSKGFVYALKCGNNKYYVGRSSNLTTRFNAHKNGKGSVWTKLHGAESIVELCDDTEFEEIKLTMKYMKMHGIDNVRGGPFCKQELPVEDVKCIERILKSDEFMRKDIPDSDSNAS